MNPSPGEGDAVGSGGGGVRVAVDLGASMTGVAVQQGSGEPRTVWFDGQPHRPSGVFFDGCEVVVGHAARHRAAREPDRYEPHPLLRIDEGALLLGEHVLPVERALGRGLAESVAVARASVDRARVDELVLTHPADWSRPRVETLRTAASGLAARTATVPDSVAVAHRYCPAAARGVIVAVVVVGRLRTVVSIVRHEGPGFRLLSTRSAPTHDPPGSRTGGAVDITADALGREGAVDHRGVSTAAVLLTGGGSRITELAAEIEQRLGVVAVLDEHPHTTLALGALRARPGESPSPPRSVPSPVPIAVTAARRWRVPTSPARRIGAVAVILIVVATTLGTVVVFRDGGADVRTLTAQHARMDVPRSWRESQQSETAGTARMVLTPDGSPQSARRLLLVQTLLNGGPTAAEVAVTLARQLDENRGDETQYDEFDAAARYADRPVIAYRERVRSGGLVRWFVMVSGRYQLSVGCQSPTVMQASERSELDSACERAVRSVISVR